MSCAKRRRFGRDDVLLVNLSGRGDKDVQTVEQQAAGRRRVSRIEGALPDAARGRTRTGLVTYITAGDPDLERSGEILLTLDRAGVDVLEVGVPFSDPLADGPVIQRATERAIAGRRDAAEGARPRRAAFGCGSRHRL